MDTLLNEFTVNRPIEETWAVLTDVERIAPCMPGAELHEIEGDIYRGVVKVKLGAISAAFKGQASFVERDDSTHKAVLKGEGRDTTGKGNADALITAQLESVSAETTKCIVSTELRITGKVAQFGRGIMGDVSKKLINQFATNLNTMLDKPAAAAEAPAAAKAPAAAEAPPVGAPPVDAAPSKSIPDKVTAPAPAPAAGEQAAAVSTPTSPTTPPTDQPKVRKINGPANEPIELSDVAGSAILKRALPAFGGLVLVMLLLRRFIRR